MTDPYPWAIEEGFDAYRTLMETKGQCIGIRSGRLAIVLTGDSALVILVEGKHCAESIRGANICATIMLRILEHPTGVPRPISMILAYPALDFNFTSWMSPANLRVLRTEQSETHIPGIIHPKDHMRHKSPLSVVDDVKRTVSVRTRQQSWGAAIGSKLPGLGPTAIAEKGRVMGTRSQPHSPAASTWTKSLPRTMSAKVSDWLAPDDSEEGNEAASDSGSEDDTATRAIAHDDSRPEADKALRERVKTPREERRIELTAPTPVLEQTETVAAVVAPVKRKRAPIGTRLTMTSRTGYFQDRIISPTMVSNRMDLNAANGHRCALWLSFTLVPAETQILRPTITSPQSSLPLTSLNTFRQSI